MARAREKNHDKQDSDKGMANPFRQSSVVPYRILDSGIEIMMITSIRRRRWIIPKGAVEPYMTPQDSAAKEAFEEAGIEGTVAKEPLGRYHYKKWSGICRCDVYAMKVETIHDTWQEQEDRDREWIDAKEAINRLRHKQLKSIVKKFLENPTASL